MLRNLSVLFSWAVNQQHMTENPCLGITVEESTVKKSAVRILSLEEGYHFLLGFAAAQHRRDSQIRGLNPEPTPQFF